MASKAAVQELVQAGADYDEIAERLGIRPGLAYLLATGLPADGSDAPAAGAHQRTGFLADSQQLSNPQPAENPTSKTSVLEWIKQRTAGDAPMRAASQARTADPGEEQEGDEPADAIDVLTRDHNQVNALLKQLSSIPGVKKGGSPARLSERKSIVDMITVILSRHETAEEQHLWPTVRDVLDDGDQRADTALGQEQHGKEVLTALGELDGDEEEFDDLVEELSAAARKHVAFETTVFLELRSAMHRKDLLDLGKKIVRAREHGPTRPHPHAPDTGPALAMAGPAGAAMDKTRDALGHRPADRRGTASEDALQGTDEQDTQQDIQDTDEGDD
jgi:hypothetical protein